MGRTHDTDPTARPPGPSRRRRAARSGLFCALLVGLAAQAGGCKPHKRYDLIEAELRTRDRELAETRAELDRSRAINRGYEQTRPLAYPGGSTAGSPPVPAAACAVQAISLGRGTGGVDDDGVPGDESLMVVIVPTDEDKSAVKVPARATIAAWEITPQGLKTPIGSWELSAEQLRPTWRSGLLATGYFITLPWQTAPSTDRLRVAVRLTTLDGRPFETDRDVTVHPSQLTGGSRGAPVPVSPAFPSAPGVVPPSVRPPGSREPLFPGAPPAGVPPQFPAGVEELPPPAGLPTRGAHLLPPEKP